MRLFGKKDVYEAPVAQVVDFESDYVMAAPAIDSVVGGGSASGNALSYVSVFSAGPGDDRDF